MSGKPFAWGHEHFCAPDATELYNREPGRINNPALGFPIELDANPVPATFCSVCLQWFDNPEQHPEGSDHRPPQKGTA